MLVMPVMRSSHTSTVAGASGRYDRLINTPRARNRLDGGGDFSKGMSQPQYSAKASQEDRDEAHVEALSIEIKSSMHCQNTDRNKIPEHLEHQSAYREKFSGAERDPKS
jgi:hypothetical protein